MRVRSVYLLATGQLTGQTLVVPEADEVACTPPGCGLVDGAWPADQWRVDMQTQQVVALAPAKPDDTQEFSWEWSAEFGRWLAKPTLMRLRADKLASIDQAIARAEAGTDRALRELVLASSLPQAARARFVTIEQAVSALRAIRAQVASAATLEAIEALHLPAEA